ncbi:MAG: hypothetical protein IPM82_10090 [Saprospiraceae bacterium]|nr:hypothetical protein [Saprospiraceae bacterium]
MANAGVLTEQAQALEVKLEEGLTIIDASEPYSQDGQFVIFEIGDIGKFESGTIKFNVALNCDVPLGAAHCIEARLMESMACPPVWADPFLSIDGECGIDSVHFVLSNIGSESMALGQQFRLFEDGILSQNSPFILSAGDSLVFEMPANGKTMRLETEQIAGYPELSRPSATIEGCGLDENGFARQEYFQFFIMMKDFLILHLPALKIRPTAYLIKLLNNQKVMGGIIFWGQTLKTSMSSDLKIHILIPPKK